MFENQRYIGTEREYNRIASVCGMLYEKPETRKLLVFAQKEGIALQFDPNLPEDVKAVTVMRESRLPANHDSGTIILLNPNCTLHQLSVALGEKLAWRQTELAQSKKLAAKTASCKKGKPCP